jgi:hypothetical protein
MKSMTMQSKKSFKIIAGFVDSGRRMWSERTGRYEIVWVAREFADRDRQKKRH